MSETKEKKRNSGRVSLNKRGEADVLLTQKGDKEYIHLINISGEHRSERIKTFDSLPPLYGAEIVYKCAKMPKKVLLQPGGRAADCTYAAGELRVRVEKTDIHTIVEIGF